MILISKTNPIEVVTKNSTKGRDGSDYYFLGIVTQLADGSEDMGKIGCSREVYENITLRRSYYLGLQYDSHGQYNSMRVYAFKDAEFEDSSVE